MINIADRAKQIQPFHVMKILARAKELEAQGRDIVHMEVGEPDFTTPQSVIAAAIAAVTTGEMFYTPATGLPALRKEISEYYQTIFHIDVPVERIMITPGASGGLFVVLSALLDTGDKVMLADPGYPCNKHFVNLLSGNVVAVPVTRDSNFQLTLKLVEANWQKGIRIVLLASPANPTGTCVDPVELKKIIEFCRTHKAVVVVDEIYQNLVYDIPPVTALNLGNDVIVINSFSKYFCMTGYRIGWLVAPVALMTALDNLSQNLFLAAPTPSQYAALAAFKPETIDVLEQRKKIFAARRNFLLQALADIGLAVPVVPDGAFYVYVDVSKYTDDSYVFSETCLEKAGVAVTPGIDFGDYKANHYIRLAYTTDEARLQEGVQRLATLLK